jgi:hypothetical protein
MEVDSVRQELDAVRIAIRNASNEWERCFVWYGSGRSPDADSEYTQYLIEIAYYSLVALLDKHKLSKLSEMLVLKWATDHAKDLLASEMSEYAEEPMLKATSTLWTFMSALDNVFLESAKFAETKLATNFKNMLEMIPSAAFGLKFCVDSEKKLEQLVEAILLTIFPDLNSNPSVTNGKNYRQPDSAISSTQTLLEYKFISSKESVASIIDEMQADIRNYAQAPWETLYFVIGQTQPFMTSEQLKNTLLREPSTFKNIEIVLIMV